MNVLSFARLVLFAFVMSIAVPALADAHGVLRVVKGDVQIKTPDGQVSKARLGQEVHPKDTIITGKDARAKIVMIDNNEINVSPESNVEIQNYEFKPEENKKDVLLNVIYGKVRSKVEQKYDGKTSKFQVKTPSAVAGVRGTDFITGYSPQTQQTQVVTFRGAVEFGTPGPNGSIQNSVSVTPGKMASNSGGAAPSSPVNVPKDQLAKMDHESNAATGGGNSQGQDQRTPAQDGKKGGDKGGDSDKGSDNGKGGGNSQGASNSSGSSSGSGSSSSAATGGTSTADSSGSSTSSSSSGGTTDTSRSTASTSAPSTSTPTTTTSAPTVTVPTGSMINPTADLASGTGGANLVQNIPVSPTVTQTVSSFTPPPAAVTQPTATTNCTTACQSNTQGPVSLKIHINP